MKRKPKIKSLKALGSSKTRYQYDGADRRLLESFPNPGRDVRGTVLINAPEFTSLCPITGQPDYATIEILYCPDQKCVESKSLKLYLGSFRQHGMYHEGCVYQIMNDLVTVLDPKWIKVTGKFSPRGGISFWPVGFWKQMALPTKEWMRRL